MVLKVSYVGRLGRRLLAQADANQVLDFPDPVSGQLFSQAFAAITTQARAGVPSRSLQRSPGLRMFCLRAPWSVNSTHCHRQSYGSNNTQAAALNSSLRICTAMATSATLQPSISLHCSANVGSAAQFSENTFYTNKGFSSYNGLLLTLQKNLSHGLNYDFNYTFQHSIDNVSFFANSQGDTGIGGIG